MNENDRKHGAQQRENPDPEEGARPIPGPVLLLIGAMLVWGIGYIALTQHDDDPTLGDHRTLSTLQGKTASAGGGGAVDGAQVYAAQCVACHQATGAGLPGVFPPLASSEWVNGPEAVVSKIVLLGVTGKLTVKGAAFNGQMPTFRDKLSDAEIAAVLSYARTSFGNSSAKFGPEVVKAAREETKDHKDPWGGDDELSKLKQ